MGVVVRTLGMTVLVVVLCLAGGSRTAEAGGQWITNLTHYSEAMDEMREFGIYLPQGYGNDPDFGYPVVYFLHGYGPYRFTTHWDYFQFQSRIDDMIEHGDIPPCIVVLPDGREQWDGSWYSNSELYGNHEDWIAHDLVQYVDENYQTRQDRTSRIMTGHSMGGYGAIRIALNNPEVFGGVASYAGNLCVIPIQIEWLQGSCVAEAVGEPGSYEYHPTNGSQTLFTFSLAGAWSPNLDNLPYQVDFPFDEWGDVVEEVEERWRQHGAPRRAAEYAQSIEDTVDVWIGYGDADGLGVMTECFADSLDALGVPYELVVYPGDHLVLPLEIAMPYLLHFSRSGVAVEDAGLGPQVAMRVLPNPSLGSTTVAFTLASPDRVRLVVHDVGGRIVRRVFDGMLEAGPQSLAWDGKSDAGVPVADGVYFVALSTGAGTEVMRTVRLK